MNQSISNHIIASATPPVIVPTVSAREYNAMRRRSSPDDLPRSNTVLPNAQLVAAVDHREIDPNCLGPRPKLTSLLALSVVWNWTLVYPKKSVLSTLSGRTGRLFEVFVYSVRRILCSRIFHAYGNKVGRRFLA